MEGDDKIASPNRAAIEAAEHVYHTVQRVFPEAVADFESKWAEFQVVCHSLPTSARCICHFLSTVRANSCYLAAQVSVRERTSSRLSRSRVQKSLRLWSSSSQQTLTKTHTEYFYVGLLLLFLVQPYH